MFNNNRGRNQSSHQNGPSSSRGYNNSGRGQGARSGGYGFRNSAGSRPPRGGNGGGKNRGQYIHPSLFVRKAETVAETKPYESKHKFNDFKFDERTKANITARGYITPTPIQDESIPLILNNLDVVGIANTGTGKTAAFLLPLLNNVLLNPNKKVLVVVPTRELAQQINDEFISFRRNMRIFSVCCVGGAYINQQISGLRCAHNFVIGTPGRLKDLINRRSIDPAAFSTLVLDEADRMLDMGFVNDIRYIASRMQASHQTLFFSATTTPEINGLIKEFLREPTTISVKTGDTSKSIDQDVIRLRPGEEKIDVLHDLLNQPGFDKVLVFGRTKHGVERLSNALNTRGFKSESIHGDKTQSRRQKALHAFKNDYVNVLVATDVAARGLDIPAVSHVINFDVPATYEDYVHRIGRTGRAGQTGKALTFLG